MDETPRGDPKPLRRPFATGKSPLDLLPRKPRAGTCVTWRPSGGEHRLPGARQSLRRTETGIYEPCCLQLPEQVRIDFPALGLPIGSCRAADVRPFIPFQAQPSQLFEQLARGRLG